MHILFRRYWTQLNIVLTTVCYTHIIYIYIFFVWLKRRSLWRIGGTSNPSVDYTAHQECGVCNVCMSLYIIILQYWAPYNNIYRYILHIVVGNIEPALEAKKKKKDKTAAARLHWPRPWYHTGISNKKRTRRKNYTNITPVTHRSSFFSPFTHYYIQWSCRDVAAAVSVEGEKSCNLLLYNYNNTAVGTVYIMYMQYIYIYIIMSRFWFMRRNTLFIGT